MENWFVYNLAKDQVVKSNLSESEAEALAERLNAAYMKATGKSEIFYVPDFD